VNAALRSAGNLWANNFTLAKDKNVVFLSGLCEHQQGLYNPHLSHECTMENLIKLLFTIINETQIRKLSYTNLRLHCHCLCTVTEGWRDTTYMKADLFDSATQNNAIEWNCIYPICYVKFTFEMQRSIYALCVTQHCKIKLHLVLNPLHRKHL